MNEHDYLRTRSHLYREALDKSHKTAKAARDYRTKWLELRKAVRDYFDGNISQSELEKLAGR